MRKRNVLCLEGPPRDTAARRKLFENEGQVVSWKDAAVAEVNEERFNIDLTPDTQLLARMPVGYDHYSSLLENIDNSLQAVYKNPQDVHRKISVRWDRTVIEILDNGPGMALGGENSVQKWGQLGSSTHRDVHQNGAGIVPPFAVPYFGLYGVGGLAAALKLGSKIVVTSKTVESAEVVTMVIDEGKLQKNNWAAVGYLRKPADEDEDASFTRVKITELKKEVYKPSEEELHRKLSDIYHLYLQEDLDSGETLQPVEFLVNGRSLADVNDGEVAKTNYHSAPEEPFVVDIIFSRTSRPGERRALQARARITVLYFPCEQGMEKLETVLAESVSDKSTNFDNAWRRCIRWLGRLLPNSYKRNLLPFMEPQRNPKGLLLRNAKARVRAYIDTDAGFKTTKEKTDLDAGDDFTASLLALGCKIPQGISLCMQHRGNKFSALKRLKELYLQWLEKCHNEFDREITMLGEGTFLFSPDDFDIQELQVNSHVIIVHEAIQLETESKWKAGNHLIIPAGISGSSREELWVTIERFIVEYIEGALGPVKMIVRPIEVAESQGSHLSIEGTGNGGRRKLEMREAQLFPANLLMMNDKCQNISNSRWSDKERQINGSCPDQVEVISPGTLPSTSAAPEIDFPLDGTKVQADDVGKFLPETVFAVVRPKQWQSHQRGIGMVCSNAAHTMRLTCEYQPLPELRGIQRPPYEEWEAQSKEYQGIKGIFKFSIRGFGKTMTSAGVYSFRFKVDSPAQIKTATIRVSVLPGKVVGEWKVHQDFGSNGTNHVMPGRHKTPAFRLAEKGRDSIFIAQYDKYGNPKPFPDGLRVGCHVLNRRYQELDIETTHMVSRSAEGPLQLEIQSLTLVSGNLETVEADGYKAWLRFTPAEGCYVFPGFEYPATLEKRALCDIQALPGTVKSFCLEAGPHKDGRARMGGSPSEPPRTSLKTKDIISCLRFKGLDQFRNPIDKAQEIYCELKQGLQWDSEHGVERRRLLKASNSFGVVSLSRQIQVTGPLNSEAWLIITNKSESCALQFRFQLAQHTLEVHIPDNLHFYSGTEVCGVQVIFSTSEGESDDYEDGSLELDWEPRIQCSFVHGIAALPPIRLPTEPGLWKGKVTHALYKELQAPLEIQVLPPRATHIACNGQPLMVNCGEPFHVQLTATSNDKSPASLEWSGTCLLVMVERKDSGQEEDAVEAEIAEVQAGREHGAYTTTLTMTGATGRYIVRVQPADLVAMADEAAAAPEPQLALEVVLRAGTARELEVSPRRVSVAAQEELPPLTVHIVDGWGNACRQYAGEKLCVRWEACLPPDAEHAGPCELPNTEPAAGASSSGSATWLEQSSRTAAAWTEVPVAEASELGSCTILGVVAAVPAIGDHHLYVSTAQLLAGCDSPLRARVEVTVEPGHYACGLRLLGPELSGPGGSGDQKPWVLCIPDTTPPLLPDIVVKVDAADGAPLMQNYEEQIVLLGLEEGGKRDIGVYQPYAVGGGDGCTPRLCVFSGVPCPQKAGNYPLRISSSREPQQTAVLPIDFELILLPGKPAALRLGDSRVLVRMRSGEACQLGVEVLDRYENVVWHHWEHDKKDLRGKLFLCSSREAFHGDGAASPIPSPTLCGKATADRGQCTFRHVRLREETRGLKSLRAEVVGPDFKVAQEWPLVVYDAGTEAWMEAAARAIERREDASAALRKAEARVDFVSYSLAGVEDKLLCMGPELQASQGNLEVLEQELAAVQRSAEEGEDTAVLEEARRQDEQQRSTGQDGLAGRLALGPASWVGNDRVLGVVGQLAAVDDLGLSRALGRFLGNDLLAVVATDDGGERAVRESAAADGATRHVINLRRVARESFYTGVSGEAAGEQSPLPSPGLLPIPTSGDTGAPAPPPGFLAHAVNTLHVDGRRFRHGGSGGGDGGGGHEYGLRETLFYVLLGAVQVYRDEESLTAAYQDGHLPQGSGVSLDGGLIRNNVQAPQGTGADLPGLFRVRSYKEKVQAEPLLPSPAGPAFRRCCCATALSAKINEVRAAAQALEERLAGLGRKRGDLTRRLEEAREERESMREHLLAVEREVDGYTGAMGHDGA